MCVASLVIGNSKVEGWRIGEYFTNKSNNQY